MNGWDRLRYLSSSPMMNGKGNREQAIVVTALTLDELAAKMSIDPAALRVTVERSNDFARTGVDADFGHRRAVYYYYDYYYYDDPSVKPNRNLGTIEKRPFTAMQFVPGDLGTKGGLLPDEHVRVLGEGGTPIDGLYVAGNSTASVMGRTYPGLGSTISPAVIFGSLGARHAAEQSQVSRSAANSSAQSSTSQSSSTETLETENVLP